MDSALDDAIRRLFDCKRDIRFGLAIYYSSFAVFMFDYGLTFSNEVRIIWRLRRLTVNSLFFYLSRYTAFLCMLVVIIWPVPTLLSEKIAIILRLASVITSEVILALRTWALWERTKTMAWSLAAVAVACVIPAAAVIGKDLSIAKYVPVSPELEYIAKCQTITSGFASAYIFPYLLTIFFELVTFGLCIVKIVKLRTVTGAPIPLAERLWRDGMLYYVCMLCLSIVNILLVVQSSSPQLRSGAAHLQAALHSMIATRILMHLASMGRGEQGADEAPPIEPSNTQWPSSGRFTSRFSPWGSKNTNSRSTATTGTIGTVSQPVGQVGNVEEGVEGVTEAPRMP